MDQPAMNAFTSRNWTAVAEVKSATWRRTKATSSPEEILSLGHALWCHALSVRPGWPSAADRAADAAVHQRVSEALRAVSRRPV